MATKTTAELFIGADRDLVVAVKQEDAVTVQVVTGWTMSWTLAASRDGDAIVTKTVGSGITLTDAASGIVTVALEDDDTADLAAGTYYGVLWRTGTDVLTPLNICTITLDKVTVPA